MILTALGLLALITLTCVVVGFLAADYFDGEL